MQPKLIAVSVAAALAGMSGPSYAGPLDKAELWAMAYVSLPYGGVSRSQEGPILGFAVSHRLREQRDGIPIPRLQPASVGTAHSMMDLRFNIQQRTWDRFRLGGLDALSYKTRMKADGSTEPVRTLTEIPTAVIVAG